jgi:putative DNA primase/helicase
VRNFIERHGESRFAQLHNPPPDAPIIRDRAGYWIDGEHPDDLRLFLFYRSSLREATSGHDFNRVLNVLDAVDALVKKSSKQRSFPTRTPDGQVPHLYWINPEKLQ